MLDKNQSFSLHFPLDGHTGYSLANLIIMVYKYEFLLSKSTGGYFYVPEKLHEAVNARYHLRSIPAFLSALDKYQARYGSIQGLALDESGITFTGFPVPYCAKYEEMLSCLAGLMVQYARNHKYPLSRTIVNSNEQFTFRTWLRRLGMEKTPLEVHYRHLLLAPLSGAPYAALNPNGPRGKGREN